MTQDQLDLLHGYLNGTLDEADLARFQSLLRESAEARRTLRSLSTVEAKLTQLAAIHPETVRLLSETARQRGPSFRWLSWRPLAAAAAGIVFGMLCTSVVFGFVVQRGFEKKTPLAVVQPSFEDTQMPLVKEFPPAPALWGGNVAKVVSAENELMPKDGHLMLRLETTASGAPVLYPRLYQVIALPPSTAELRDIEVSASFATADPGSSPYYSIRVYAVTQAPELLDPDWFDHRNDVIAMAARGMDNPPDSTGWQSFGLRMQVPGKARCLVVFFGVKNQAKSQAKKPHYLDAVQVSFIDSPSIP